MLGERASVVDILDTQFEGKNIDIDGNFAVLGDDINIMEKDQTLRKVLIGAGWDLNAFNTDALDLDLSVLLVDKDGQTRVDEDFVFYNATDTLEGAVKHNGDSRTGAGDGDDESISIDLQGVPFDVMQILIVLSIYKGFEKEQNMGMVRGAYVRIVNEENDEEIVRYKLDSDLEDKEESGAIIAALNREGPKWHFKPLSDFASGGLAEIAQKRGMVIGQQ